MSMLIFYLLIALVFSFFCSLSEAVLLSVRPAFVTALENRGVKGATRLRALKSDLDRPLAAILSLNTIAHTVGAAGVGAQASLVFGSAYLGLTSAVLTLLILVLSEIIPKSLGTAYWQQLAPTIGMILSGLTRIMAPFVWFARMITRFVVPEGASAFNFSRDEFAAMAEIGAETGHIDEKELKIVGNLMRLRALSIRDVMTPRPVIFMMPADMMVGDFFAEHAAVPFSRIPVFGENRDEVTGYVLKSDLLVAQAHDQFGRALREFERPWLVLADFHSVSEVFDRLIHEKAHIALVVDEYGTVQGLVTLEDIVETLIGLEITDELDTIEDMRLLAQGRWKERIAALGIDPNLLDTPKT